MTTTPQRASALPLLLFASASSAEVIFSRRVYKEYGASYQQIRTWNPATGVLKALTNSPRDHYHPSCDGRTIAFTSPSPDAAIVQSVPVESWTLNPVTGEETRIGLNPEPKEKPVSQMAARRGGRCE
jgi:hypothetical protein